VGGTRRTITTKKRAATKPKRGESPAEEAARKQFSREEAAEARRAQLETQEGR